MDMIRSLFVDLDGVLANFDAGYYERFGVMPDKASDNVDWDRVRATPNFYRDLPPMPDLDVLWKGIHWLNPTILTGVPSNVQEAADNKRAWVTKHLGNVPMIACKSKEKCLHMRDEGDILIDDWEKYKMLWLGEGGLWITHTSALTSLHQLSVYLLER